ncbi:MAG TPA: porphobilinogen synthase, partial [Candidatus Ozemobacteraceae bacterium]|nr:porphobilinogen synthase [Candidatus Ozemobacteraceae bacterium]
GVIPLAIRKIRESAKQALIITDVCLCAYTSHGHCGIVNDKGLVLNDESLPYLGEMALAHARAGADIIAPSDMMDGRIGALRALLDLEGFTDTPILSYAAKYASSFYGPFRDAAHSAPAFGDRRTYQMDPGNRREALCELQSDLEEGADMLMVKPALPCLDVIREARDQFECPIAAYQVSGEYAMIKLAAAQGWLDERQAVNETLTAIRRAGADFIMTYFAIDAANHLVHHS